MLKKIKHLMNLYKKLPWF